VHTDLVPANWVLDRMVARVQRLCSSPLDERSLRAAILLELQRTIGFDYYVWLLTDPVTTVGCAPLADVPCLPELAELIRLKYLTPTNRWTTLLGGGAVGRLSDFTGPEVMTSSWREFLQRHGVADIASTAFADRFGCWGFLDLWRCKRRVFDRSDAELLAAVGKSITAALRTRQGGMFRVAKTVAAPIAGPAVLIINDQLHVTARTAAATEWLRSMLPTPPAAAPIPAAALNVAAQLLAAEAGVDKHPAAARSFVPGHTWLTLRASRMESADSADGRTIAVSIEETPTAERVDLFARCHALSARERQLLELLSRNADTTEIAENMNISEYTVQDHLKSIFGKTGLSGRSALITTALGGGTVIDDVR
jgi:DNA-binding CsgD family transcriptional regulator